MSGMVRKQVYIEPRQEELLKRRARELGVSEAELIRRGIDQISRARALTIPASWEAWEEAKALIRERMQLKVPQTGRTWRRDELYDDRLRQLAH